MKRLLFILASSAALWTAACGGGGGGPVTPPPPVGKYSNSSLNGTYAFVTSGEVVTTNSAEANLSRTGSFIADGQGNIKGGIEDVVVPGQASTFVTITGGSYTINANGTGNITLDVPSLAGSSTITFGVTLTSTTGGLLIDETFTQTQASTGSGNFFFQNEADCTLPAGAISGNYVFDFSGLDASGNPESVVGQFFVSGNQITTGTTDINDDGTLTPNGPIGPASFGTDPTTAAGPNSCGRGQITIGGQPFEYYVVDATRIRFISIENGAMLTGDAFVQTTVPASLNPNYAFLIAGSSAAGFITRVGRFSTNGQTVTNALVDTNNGANQGNGGGFEQTTEPSPSDAAVTYDATNGRGTVSFLDHKLAVPFTFVFYLASETEGVIQETTLGSNTTLAVDVADGTFSGQTGNSFTSSNITGTYAMNWTGLSNQVGTLDEEDLIGQPTISNLGISGSADIYQFAGALQNGTGPQTGNTLTGTIAIPGDGAGDDGMRNTMSITITKGSSATVNFVVYFVNPQLAFFANTSTSSNRDVAGILQLQQ